MDSITLEQSILAQTAAMLGRELDPLEPLMQAGLKSSQAVELAGMIREQLGQAAPTLPRTLIFSLPTVREIASFISKQDASHAGDHHTTAYNSDEVVQPGVFMVQAERDQPDTQ
ncbi:MAG: acyl carrier protein, partial [Pseudomonadota bacterium]|nr:acyl carrier protein [Pseudomonadota bacterium]